MALAHKQAIQFYKQLRLPKIEMFSLMMYIDCGHQGAAINMQQNPGTSGSGGMALFRFLTTVVL